MQRKRFASGRAAFQTQNNTAQVAHYLTSGPDGAKLFKGYRRTNMHIDRRATAPEKLARHERPPKVEFDPPEDVKQCAGSTREEDGNSGGPRLQDQTGGQPAPGLINGQAEGISRNCDPSSREHNHGLASQQAGARLAAAFDVGGLGRRCIGKVDR